MAIHTYRVLDRRAVFYTKALREGVSISLKGCKDVENVKGAGKLLELVYDLQLFKASFASSVVGLASVFSSPSAKQ